MEVASEGEEKRSKSAWAKLWPAAALIVGAIVCCWWVWGGQTQEVAMGAESELERRLAEVLGAMDGVGRVKVMITLQEELEEPIAEASNLWGTSLSTMEGTASSRRSVLGVIVIAEGAEEAMVRLALCEAVHVALQVPMDRVEVFGMARETK